MEPIENVETADNNNSMADNISHSAKKELVLQKKLLIVALLLSRTVSASTFPLLEITYPQEAKLRGINNVITSFLFGVYPFINLFVPQMVRKAVLYFKLKHIIYVALISSSISTILFGMLKFIPNTRSLNILFTALSFVNRAVESCSCGTINNAIMIFFATEFPEHISTLFGLLQLSTGFAFASGPLFGGIFYDIGGFYLPFVIYGFLLGVCLVCDICFLRTTSNQITPEKKSISYSWEIMLNVIQGAIVTIPFAFLDVFLGLHLEVFSFSRTALGAMYFLLSLSFSLSSIPNVQIAYKVSDPKLLLIVLNILLAGIILLSGPWPPLGIRHKYLWLDIFTLLMFGYLYNLASTIPYRLITETIMGTKTEQTLHEASVINGIYYTSIYLGYFSGFSIAGSLFDLFGYGWSLAYEAFLILLFTFILIYQKLSKWIPNMKDLRILWNNKEEENHLLNSIPH